MENFFVGQDIFTKLLFKKNSYKINLGTFNYKLSSFEAF